LLLSVKQIVHSVYIVNFELLNKSYIVVPRPSADGYWTTHRYSNSWIANSRTGHLADWSTSRLDKSRTGQLADTNCVDI